MCHGSAPHLVRWNQTYAPRDLHVLSIYRTRLCPEDPVTEDGVRRWVAENKIVHPVLVDGGDHYRRRLEPGPLEYPVAYLVDPDGVVVWEGGTDRTAFAEACEQALERFLPPAPDGAPR